MQKKEFLEQAFAAMTVDEAAAMRDLAQKLLKERPEGVDVEAHTDEQVGALDELCDLVESVDNAKNLFVVGGFGPLLACLAPGRAVRLQRRAAEVLATVVQNNPKAQLWALQAGTLPTLVALLPGGGGAVDLVGTHEEYSLWASVVSAISALVRDSAGGQRDLVVRSQQLPRVVDLAVRAAHAGRALPHSGGDAPPQGVDRGAKAARRCLRKALFFFRHLVTGSEADRVLSYLARGVGGAGEEEGLFLPLACALIGQGVLEEHGDDVDLSDARENTLAIVKCLAEPARPFAGIAHDACDHKEPRGLGPMGAGRAGQVPAPMSAPLPAAEPAVDPPAPVLLLGGPPGPPCPATGLSVVHTPSSTTSSGRSTGLSLALPTTTRPGCYITDELTRRAALRQAGLVGATRAHAERCLVAAASRVGEAEGAGGALQDEAALAADAHAAMVVDTQG